MTTEDVMREIMRAITTFDGAARAFAWRGSAPVEDRKAIDADYKRARKELEALIRDHLR